MFVEFVAVGIFRFAAPQAGSEPALTGADIAGFHQFPHAFAIRKAFARRENRVKYAAAEYHLKVAGWRLTTLKQEGNRTSATGTAREESQAMEFIVTKSALHLGN